MGHCHKVGTGSLHGRFSLDQRQKLHQALSLYRVVPSLMDQSGTPNRAFDRNDLDIAKTGSMNFGCQVFGAMKVGCREVGWVVRRIAVLTRRDILRNDLAKLSVSKKTVR
jgi:hypothetical protein